MSYDIVSGNWKYLKGRLQEYWGDLSDDEIKKIEGNYSSLTGLLQEKYGLAKNKAEDEIGDFLDIHFSKEFKKKSEHWLEQSLEKIKNNSSDLNELKEKAYRALKSSPIKFLGITFLTGFIISRLIK